MSDKENTRGTQLPGTKAVEPLTRLVPMSEWDRAGHAELFGRLEVPFYSITFPIAADSALSFAKKNGLSVYHVIMYCVMQAVNSVPAFLYKLRGKELVEHKWLSPSYTYMYSDELFGIATLDWVNGESIYDFCSRARAAERSAAKPLPTEEEDDRDDLVFISCIPWFEYTQVTQEMSLNRDDSIPRLMWGRAVERDGERQLPFTAQVNHRLIDGVHIYKLKSAVEREFRALTEEK